jgi:hypothetical protein
MHNLRRRPACLNHKTSQLPGSAPTLHLAEIPGPMVAGDLGLWPLNAKRAPLAPELVPFLVSVASHAMARESQSMGHLGVRVECG